IEAAVLEEADTVLSSVVGMAGLKPTLAAIDAGKNIALANKEILVCAGKIIMERAKKRNVPILPVDSEHSALFQCINGEKKQYIKKMILTASGGPFFGKTPSEMESITPAQALNHPNWKMGRKITVDSATLMNKGLEFIEAMWLFDLTPSQISIVIHKESIVHSMVEFTDHSVIAQMSLPDMRLPIQYALSWPERSADLVPELDLTKIGSLTFFEPDFDSFKCLSLALQAAKLGGNSCAVLNGANEAAVDLFLRNKIGFNDIAEKVNTAILKIPYIKDPRLDDLLSCDREARSIVYDSPDEVGS
ncbi:MAG: 1-deoxy-D-xylulose-5-phosphate reductoisomerase, partial [Bacillota bacterium]|nr:1-deoxy-D-xylulose-5-phosphate reductoisomerase [Bacillota bacterium]